MFTIKVCTDINLLLPVWRFYYVLLGVKAESKGLVNCLSIVEEAFEELLHNGIHILTWSTKGTERTLLF